MIAEARWISGALSGFEWGSQAISQFVWYSAAAQGRSRLVPLRYLID